MTVIELIAVLVRMPPETEVKQQDNDHVMIPGISWRIPKVLEDRRIEALS